MSEWTKVAEESAFDQIDRILVDLGEDKQIAIFKREDGYFAVSVWCSHQKTSLLNGEVVDHEVECPLHGARFDLRTGKQLCLPAVRPIASYPLKVEERAIYLQV